MMSRTLFDDYNIPYTEQSNGWVNTRCPFCGDTGEHLGCAPNSLAFHCWKCGWHPADITVSQILGISIPEARKVVAEHRKATPRASSISTDRKVKIQPFKLPPNEPLTKAHRAYLRQRGFDPGKIARQWGLSSTGPIALLDGINYAYRILIPINWGGEMVTFQARDTTGRSDTKYLACPAAREVKSIKSILYIDEKYWAAHDTCILVEGVTDVWRLGPAAGATFGIDFKLEQVLAIPKHMKRVWILYDPEPQAQRQARKLMVKLEMMGKEVHRYSIGNSDPGDLSQSEADYLVKQLIT